MVDHLQSRVTPWRQYASHVKVGGTLSKMDVNKENQATMGYSVSPHITYDRITPSFSI